MLSRRELLERASCALLSLGGQATSARTPGASVQVFYDPNTLRHEPPRDHPEGPQRLDAVMRSVRLLEPAGRVSVDAPRPATEDNLLLVHSHEYVTKVRAEIAAGRRTLSTGDTEISPGSLTAALAAAGTVVTAVDAVMTGRTRTAFCAV